MTNTEKLDNEHMGKLNAVKAKNQQNMLEQAAKIQGVSQVYKVDTVAYAIISQNF